MPKFRKEHILYRNFGKNYEILAKKRLERTKQPQNAVRKAKNADNRLIGGLIANSRRKNPTEFTHKSGAERFCFGEISISFKKIHKKHKKNVKTIEIICVMCYYIIILSENSVREYYAWAIVAGEMPENRSGVKEKSQAISLRLSRVFDVWRKVEPISVEGERLWLLKNLKRGERRRSFWQCSWHCSRLCS